MMKKQTLTSVQIESDIIDALKNPPKKSAESYKRWTIPEILLVVVGVAAGVIYPMFIVWLSLALLVFVICHTVFCFARLKKQIKMVTIDDYDITKETVSSTSEEHFRADAVGSLRHRHTEKIDNYTVHFDNGKSWRIPKELYRWDDRLRMRDADICSSIHRTDTLIAVTKKETGEVVVAYNTNVFEYR